MLSTGALLVSIALLTLAALMSAFNRSNPPRWAKRGWIEELVTVSIAGALAFGFAYLVAGAADALEAGSDYLDLGLLVLVVFASALIWRRLRARTRLREGERPASLDARVPEHAHRSSIEPPQAVATGPSPPKKAA